MDLVAGMTDRRRGESKQLKKDSHIKREVLDEIGAEVVQDAADPQYQDANRDQARGDWDRSGRRGDEGSSRDDLARPGDDGLGPKAQR